MEAKIFETFDQEIAKFRQSVDEKDWALVKEAGQRLCNEIMVALPTTNRFLPYLKITLKFENLQKNNELVLREYFEAHSKNRYTVSYTVNEARTTLQAKFRIFLISKE